MVQLTGEGAAFALERLAREQMKHKLLADINISLAVCEVEGWSKTEYLHDLHTLIRGLCPCKRGVA